MEERRRHNHPCDRNNIAHKFDEVELQSTCHRSEGGQERGNNVGYHRTNSNAAYQTQFRYYRTRTGLVFIIGVMLWSLFYYGVNRVNQLQPDISTGSVDKPIDMAHYQVHPRDQSIDMAQYKTYPRDRINMVDNHLTTASNTSANRSEYVILNAPNHTGFLHIHIRARDRLGQYRRSGGDFWFATLSYPGSKNPFQHKVSTSGKIVDYRNGTYSVHFYIGWTVDRVTVDINITLANSNDATLYMRSIYWKTEGKTVWNGYFHPTLESHNPPAAQEGAVLPSTGDVSECTVRRNGPRTEECEYWFSQAMGQTVFVCHKPRNNTKCASLYRINHNSEASTRVTLEIAGRFLDMFQGDKYATRLIHGPQTIVLLPGHGDEFSELSKIVESRPLCGPIHDNSKLNPDPMMSAGFWFNGNWTSLLCRSTHWRDKTNIGNCLRNRELTLSGDSTSRQWATYLIRILQGIPIVPFGKDNFKAQRYIPAFNFTLNFLFHPLVQTIMPQTFNDVIHTVQLLEDLGNSRGGCDKNVVVISPWAHFLQWTRESFHELVSLIRKAVDKFLRDCPRSKIVVKGPHARQARTREERLFGSNYTAFEWGEIMRSNFNGSGAWYLDVWDMNLSFMSRIDVHMPEAVVQQEVDMFLSYICRNNPIL